MFKSISQWAFAPKRSIPDILTLAQKADFDTIELTIDADGPIDLTVTQSQCEAIIRQASEHGLAIASVASGLGWSNPLSSPVEATRKRAIDVTSRCLEIASWLGTDALLVVPGGVYASFIPGFELVPYDVAYDNALRSVEQLVPAAEQHGVAISIENVWSMFLLSPLEMRGFIDTAGSKFVGSYFDVGNVIINGYAEQWIDILGTRIKRVHLKDFKRSTATLGGFCDLLEGDVDYPAVMASLRAIGYDGPLTAEFFNVEDQLAAISASMDRILAM